MCLRLLLMSHLIFTRLLPLSFDLFYWFGGISSDCVDFVMKSIYFITGHRVSPKLILSFHLEVLKLFFQLVSWKFFLFMNYWWRTFFVLRWLFYLLNFFFLALILLHSLSLLFLFIIFLDRLWLLIRCNRVYLFVKIADFFVYWRFGRLCFFVFVRFRRSNCLFRSFFLSNLGWLTRWSGIDWNCHY